MTAFTDYQPSLPLIPNLQAGFFENYAFANQWPGHMYSSYQPQLSTQQLANNSLSSSNFSMSSAPMQSTPFFAQNNTFDSSDYAGSSSSTLNTVLAVSTNEVFMNVSGRLALLNNNTKFDVTVGEVMRRTRAPENLGISLLGAVLRKYYLPSPSRVLIFTDPLLHMGIVIRCAAAYTNCCPNGTKSGITRNSLINQGGHKSLLEYVDEVKAKHLVDSADCNHGQPSADDDVFESENGQNAAELNGGRRLFNCTTPVRICDPRTRTCSTPKLTRAAQKEAEKVETSLSELLKLNLPCDCLISPIYAPDELLREIPTCRFIVSERF
ncbi:Abhydrolase-3 domain-containing protein [Aphelenchoides besseyi]|nr:Abhydrolase-3 domain-containing protein [Aphelenchoides besseyi]